MVEYQYETGYTTGDTGNELDHTDYLCRWAKHLDNIGKFLFNFKETIESDSQKLTQKSESTTYSIKLQMENTEAI